MESISSDLNNVLLKTWYCMAQKMWILIDTNHNFILIFMLYIYWAVVYMQIDAAHMNRRREKTFLENSGENSAAS